MKKFAIIGSGRIAHRHAEIISIVGKLLAVCDIIKEKADALASKFDIIPYYDYNEMLSKEHSIDVVVVCTPNGMHAEHSISALKKGFHVLCEKPMALRVDECREMIKFAKLANRHLFIVKQNRFNPPVLAVKKILNEGKLGAIFSIQLTCFWNRNNDYYKNSWRGSKNLDGGTLFTQFSHFIDLLYWLIGDVKEAKSFFGNYKHLGIIEFEDSGSVALKFYNGVIGTMNYTVNSYGQNMEGSLTLIGEKGTVKIGGQYLNELEYQNIEDYRITDLPPGNPPNNYGQYLGSMSNHIKVYQNLIDVLNNEGIIMANAYDGLKTVEIINKIYKSGK
jgi:predicted dehydrogenase